MCSCRSSLQKILYPLDRYAAAAAIGTLLLLLFIFSSSASAQVLLNEIYYDHPGVDEGFEFIELINTGELPVCLSRFAIEFHNGAGEGWERIWTGRVDDTITADGLFVIGEAAVNPPPEVVLELDLQNGPDALRLIEDSIVRDVVGYGVLDDPSSYETSSAQDVPAGFSLGRIPDGLDTNDNSLDFHQLLPSPGLFNIPRCDLSVSFGQEFEREINSFEPARIPYVVCNRGLMSVPDSSFVVEVRDSSNYHFVLIDRVTNALRIDPGDSIELVTNTSLSDGYHWIRLNLTFPRDERPENNEREVVLRAGTPAVLLSEVMSYPLDDCPQYIELYNASGNSVNISGWKFRDASHTLSLITNAPFLIFPLSFAVLVKDQEQLLSCFPSLDGSAVVQVEGTWPYLNHTGTAGAADSVILTDQYGLCVDRIAYPPQESESKGRSLERADLYPSVAPHTWILSSQPFGGSPGCENTVSLENPPSAEGIRAGPNPFSPLEGEVLLVEIPPLKNIDRVVSSIFDISGVKIKEIGTSAILPAVFVWDGRRKDGSVVPSGIYILACEMLAGGGRRSVERVVVGCGRKIR